MARAAVKQALMPVRRRTTRRPERAYVRHVTVEMLCHGRESSVHVVAPLSKHISNIFCMVTSGHKTYFKHIFVMSNFRLAGRATVCMSVTGPLAPCNTAPVQRNGRVTAPKGAGRLHHVSARSVERLCGAHCPVGSQVGPNERWWMGVRAWPGYQPGLVQTDRAARRRGNRTRVTGVAAEPWNYPAETTTCCRAVPSRPATALEEWRPGG